MKFGILFMSLLFLVLPIQGQNLIPNASFEQVRNLPIKINPVNNFHAERKSGHRAFSENLNYWFSANMATPDLRVLDSKYQEECAKTYNDCDTAHSGTKSLGIITYMEGNKVKEYREYIEIKLSKALTPKIKTNIEFWICRERQAQLASNNMGCYFSNKKIHADILTPILVKPQFNIDTIINMDSVQWVKIEGNFLPEQAYSFMTMGNFFDNIHTKIELTNASPSFYTNGFTSAYYLIDSIRVWQDIHVNRKENIVFNNQDIAINQAFQLEDIHFKSNSASLEESSYSILDKLALFLRQQENLNLEIHGYTDSRGSTEYNLKLSQARAKGIQEYLQKKNISFTRIKIVGHGETFAKSKTEGNIDHAADRKVEFRFIL